MEQKPYGRHKKNEFLFIIENLSEYVNNLINILTR